MSEPEGLQEPSIPFRVLKAWFVYPEDSPGRPAQAALRCTSLGGACRASGDTGAGAVIETVGPLSPGRPLQSSAVLVLLALWPVTPQGRAQEPHLSCVFLDCRPTCDPGRGKRRVWAGASLTVPCVK